MSDEMTPPEFARLFKRFTNWLDDEYFEGPQKDTRRSIGDRLVNFLGELHEIPAMSTITFPEREIPNINLAINQWLAAPGREHELVGWLADSEYGDTGLTQIMRRTGYSRMVEGPPRYRSIELPEGQTNCLISGLFLVTEGPMKAAICLTLRDRYHTEDVNLDVVSHVATHSESILLELKTLLKEHNVYRGNVLSIGGDSKIAFQALQPPARESLILPEGLLESIERNTIRFSEFAPGLRSAGRHLRRGLLFHGPPGTGKSMTIQYLLGAMRGRTTFLVTGEDQAAIKQTCDLARSLEPSTIVLEDVDLIARSRKDEDSNYPALFRLMNEMDGISQDADIMFILTTNRPEVIEPALAARPGRIDQAVFFPLPDDLSRERLLRLYAQGLEIHPELIAEMVRRTAGASASFIRELLRKATLFALERGGRASVLEHADLDGALREMVFSSGDIGAKLLGGSPRSAGFARPAPEG